VRVTHSGRLNGTIDLLPAVWGEPKMKRPQFSLKFLLIALTLLAVFMSTVRAIKIAFGPTQIISAGIVGQPRFDTAGHAIPPRP
jgi:hypothetical protein